MLTLEGSEETRWEAPIPLSRDRKRKETFLEFEGKEDWEKRQEGGHVITQKVKEYRKRGGNLGRGNNLKEVQKKGGK